MNRGDIWTYGIEVYAKDKSEALYRTGARHEAPLHFLFALVKDDRGAYIYFHGKVHESWMSP